MPEFDSNLAYRMGELERDVGGQGGLVDRVTSLEISAAEERRDKASMQRSLESNTSTLKWLLFAVASTGLTVLGAVIAFAINGGGG